VTKSRRKQTKSRKLPKNSVASIACDNEGICCILMVFNIPCFNPFRPLSMPSAYLPMRSSQAAGSSSRRINGGRRRNRNRNVNPAVSLECCTPYQLILITYLFTKELHDRISVLSTHPIHEKLQLLAKPASCQHTSATSCDQASTQRHTDADDVKSKEKGSGDCAFTTHGIRIIVIAHIHSVTATPKASAYAAGQDTGRVRAAGPAEKGKYTNN
jgi:hypothetical protein